jgi:hypothetical protein
MANNGKALCYGLLCSGVRCDTLITMGTLFPGIPPPNDHLWDQYKTKAICFNNTKGPHSLRCHRGRSRRDHCKRKCDIYMCYSISDTCKMGQLTWSALTHVVQVKMPVELESIRGVWASHNAVWDAPFWLQKGINADSNCILHYYWQKSELDRCNSQRSRYQIVLNLCTRESYSWIAPCSHMPE